MQSMTIDNYSLNYQQTGPKNQTPIFILGSAIYYPRLFQHALFQNLHLIFIDHRGFVKAPTNHTAHTLQDIVNDIEKIRVALNIEEMFLLGHSGHGFMAMAYAEQHAQHVKGIILSNLAPTNTQERQDGSIAYFESTATPERKEYFYSEIVKLQDDIRNDPANRFSHINIRMQAHSFYDFTYDGAYLWDNVPNNMPAINHLWGIEFAKFNTAQFLSSWHKPILLILSKYDFLVSPISLWNDICRNANIAPIIFDKSGHNPMLEEPEKYYQILQSFIS
ncbi:alpha/beta fold hydrolase [Wohlfahrtiimonas larvae]|uniref:Alpha/beta hydrolase n=1 Tax=Wohlfahrtiimonas larvae TaxID=1157986 RepID=A0ABP9MU59_9GAMM|nr:alpha/beta hydrolase [Wohlfahrtiimonas larvae]